MNLLKRLLCKIGLHYYEMHNITIDATLTSEYLPEVTFERGRQAKMFKCHWCMKEEIYSL